LLADARERLWCTFMLNFWHKMIILRRW
jgi:hypothetical protein